MPGVRRAVLPGRGVRDAASGTTHHADDDSPTGIDHDADADHVAIPDDEDE